MWKVYSTMLYYNTFITIATNFLGKSHSFWYRSSPPSTPPINRQEKIFRVIDARGLGFERQLPIFRRTIAESRLITLPFRQRKRDRQLQWTNSLNPGIADRLFIIIDLVRNNDHLAVLTGASGFIPFFDAAQNDLEVLHSLHRPIQLQSNIDPFA